MRNVWVLSLGAFALRAIVLLANADEPAPLTQATPPAPPIASVLPGPTCGAGCGSICTISPAPQRFWASAEYLLWWTKSVPVNAPLLTRALVSTAVDPTAGQIGSHNTAILLGDQNYDLGVRSGGRFTFGGWMNDDHSVGLEANYLFIAPTSETRGFTSDGNTLLAFPFHNVLTKKEDALLFTTPGGLAGAASLTLQNQIQSAELNTLLVLRQSDSFRLSGLAGFRYLYFSENLTYNQGNRGIPGGPDAGQIFQVTDGFDSTNNFYGGQLGLRGEYRLGNLFVSATTKVALGAVHETTDVSGFSTEQFAGIPLHTVPGGTYALSTNIGGHNQTQFAVLPELTLNVGYDITQRLRLMIGYDFLYISNVARPGTQIDHNLNPSQSPPLGGSASTLVGPAAPVFSFLHSDFWAQGINFGLQYSF